MNFDNSTLPILMRRAKPSLNERGRQRTPPAAASVLNRSLSSAAYRIER